MGNSVTATNAKMLVSAMWWDRGKRGIVISLCLLAVSSKFNMVRKPPRSGRQASTATTYLDDVGYKRDHIGKLAHVDIKVSQVVLQGLGPQDLATLPHSA